MARDIKKSYPVVTHTCYTGNTRTGVMFTAIKDQVEELMSQGPYPQLFKEAHKYHIGDKQEKWHVVQGIFTGPRFKCGDRAKVYRRIRGGSRYT